MLIPLPIGSLRIACAGARAQAVEAAKNDRERAYTKTFDQLLEGATHNGLRPTIETKAQMSDMAKRDVDHAMEEHPSQHYIKHIDTLLEMADYVELADEDDCVVIDSTEFQLLKDHLPQQSKKD